MMDRTEPSETPTLYHTIHLHSLFCLTTGPKPLSKRLIQRERSIASSFNLYYRLFSLMLSSSCLHNLPRLPVTFTLPPIYPSTRCFRRQFLRKMWSIQLAFLLFIECRLLLSSLTLSYDYYFFKSSRVTRRHITFHGNRRTFHKISYCKELIKIRKETS